MLFGLDLNDFSTGISAIITGSLLFTLLHYALSKQVKEEDLNHDAIGGYFGVIGTLYAVLIGLVIYDATSKYTSASNNISSESKAIGETHLYAKQFKSGNISSEISSLLINYIDEIVRSDWQHLAEDKNNPKAREFLSQIMLKIESIEPKTTKEEMYLPILLQSATNMAESRMVRFDNTTHSLPSCEWVLLSFSASLTLLTSLFLRVGKTFPQIALSFILSISILTSLYAVLMFSEPYKGSLRLPMGQLLLMQKVLHGEFGRF
jgi:membrane protease YdiL (CAAX protease family)